MHILPGLSAVPGSLHRLFRNSHLARQGNRSQSCTYANMCVSVEIVYGHGKLYYGKFIPNISSIMQPLHRLFRCGQKWQWAKDCQQAFQTTKRALTSAPVLIHYDVKLPLRLATDASQYGIGAVLSHIMPDGSNRPIEYASRTLSKSEQNYSQIEKEASSNVFGIKKFHIYLYGRTFSLLTDHKPLTTIFGPKRGIPTMAAARMQRWALLLAAYSYTIRYCPTQAHGNANALSWLPMPDTTAVGNPTDPTVFNFAQIAALPVDSTALVTAMKADQVLSQESVQHVKRKEACSTTGSAAPLGVAHNTYGLYPR